MWGSSPTYNRWMVFAEPPVAADSGDALVVCRGSAAGTTSPKVYADGDLNGDGIDEVIWTESNSNAFGHANGGRVDVGDWNGDGYDHLAYGIRNVYVRLWASDGLPSTRSAAWTSFVDLTIADASTTTLDEVVLADVDGDGADDLMGVDGAVYTGLAGLSGTLLRADATVVLGPSNGEDWFHQHVDSDVDHDGLADLSYGTALTYVTLYQAFLSFPDLGATATAADSAAAFTFDGQGGALWITAVGDLGGDGTEEAVVVESVSPYTGRTYILPL